MAALLPEESGLNAEPTDGELQVFAGRALDPWSLQAVDSSNHRRDITSSVTELNGLRIQAVDRNVQEDSRRLTWSGQGPASVGFFANQRTDLSGYLANGGSLVFDVKVDKAPSEDVRVGMACGTDCLAELPVTELLRNAQQGEWRTVSVSLQCLAEKGARLDMVLSPFYMTTGGEMDVSVYGVRVAREEDADIQCG